MGKDYYIGTAGDHRKQRSKRFREWLVIAAIGAFLALGFWLVFMQPTTNKRSGPLVQVCERVFRHDAATKTECLESTDREFAYKYEKGRRESALKNEQGTVLRRIRELAAAQEALVHANRGIGFRPWEPIQEHETKLGTGRHFVLGGTVAFEGDSAIKWNATSKAKFLAPNLTFVSQDIFRAGKQYCERAREIIGYCEVLIYGEITGPNWAKVHAIAPQSKDAEPELIRKIVERLAFPERFQDP